MFNLVCAETSQPVTDENGIAIVYESGFACAQAMAEWQGKTGKRYKPARIIDHSWKAREQAKFSNGEYTRPMWSDFYFHAYNKTDSQTGNKSLAYIFTTYDLPLDRPSRYAGDEITQKNMQISINPDHYLHVSKTDTSKIAFTKDEESGSADKQTLTTVGRYLTAYHPELGNELIKYINSLHQQEYQPINVQFATGEKITEIYKACHDTGVASCMTKPDHYYESSVHPTLVYSAGDLSLAYIRDADNSIKARALVWQEKKIYARLYGDYEALRSGLVTLGYSSEGNFHGAKIKRIDDDNRLVLPYLDGLQYVSVCDADWLMIDRSGDIEASTTDGLQRQPQWATCDRCESDIESEDDSVSVYLRRYSVETWCEHCANQESFYCHGTNEHVHNDRHVVIDGESYASWYALDEANYCQRTEEYTFGDTHTVHVTATMTEEWSDDAISDHAFTCRITGEYYDNEMLVFDDWTDEPRADCNQPNDQPMPEMIICARPYQAGFACAA
jgi:hypothetical protein